MPHYVDASVQTLIEGLARDSAAIPHALVPPTHTTTPPDDMAMDKLQLPTDAFASLSKTGMDRFSSPTLLLRRKKRPPMVARISMPASVFESAKFDVEDPASPPPTETILSPLPEANKLHAGHTPIVPCAWSPLPREESDPPTPVVDEALSGPLFLPPQPGDGAEDTIPLNVLDAQLEKLRLEQEHMEQKNMPPPPPPPEATPAPADTANSESERAQHVPTTAAVEPTDLSLLTASAPRSRHNSGETRRSSADDVDGVFLKKPKMNLGAPLGQA